MDGPSLPVDELPAAIHALCWPYARPPGGQLPLAAVAAQVMERGDLWAMRWLLRTAGEGPLRTVLPQVARRLSPRSLALWRCVLRIDVPDPPRVPWIAE